MFERKLIPQVQKHPILFKLESAEYHLHEELWNGIAKKCGINSGFEASQLWFKLNKSYMDYLRYGIDFKFNKEMRFMQSYLISIQSDSDEIDDFDEEELQRILDSDSETHTHSSSNPIPEKKQKKTKLPNKNEIQTGNSSSNALMKSLTKSENQTPTDSTPENSTTNSVASTIPANVSNLSSLQLIFLGYAKVLSDMPLQIQIQTKHKIAQIMNEAEINLLKVNDTKKIKEGP